jgi:hypothetical protein
MAIFARDTVVDPTSPAAPLDAYKEGRRDERRQVEAGGLDHRSVKKELDDAFNRGRQHGRAERRGSPLAVFALLVLAILIVVTAVMYVDYGSFAAAGAVIDRAVASL